MSHELLTAAQMREADARAIAAGTPGYDLMLRAGEAVARAAERMAPEGGRVLVLCGPGNNGGDGFVAARALADRGVPVELASLVPPEGLRGDAARAARDWTGPVLPPEAANPGAFDLVVDALFGAGLARDLDGDARALVERVNAAGTPVLAVDLPSGVDGDTGQARGAAVRAAATITFVRLKPGHLLQPGRALCGPVELVAIGVGDAIVQGLGVAAFANGPALWGGAFPRPGVDAHKYTRGHAVVLSGGRLHTGAARLAARGALRAGAGLVTLASPEEALAVNAAHLTAIMLRPCNGAADLEDLLADPRLNAVALGPALGVGEGTRALVAAALDSERAVVLDADAITSHAGDPEALARPGRNAGPGEGAWPVVTPHDGEFARLMRGRDGILGNPSKIERARAAAALTQAAVVLKGPDTVVAAPDGRAAVNRNGSPALATAGSGDVLAGVIAGLTAQGMPSFEAACAGVWLHAEAGARLGPGLVAEDIPEALPGVLRELIG